MNHKMELRQISSLVCCTVRYSDYNPPGHLAHFVHFHLATTCIALAITKRPPKIHLLIMQMRIHPAGQQVT